MTSRIRTKLYQSLSHSVLRLTRVQVIATATDIVLLHSCFMPQAPTFFRRPTLRPPSIIKGPHHITNRTDLTLLQLDYSFIGTSGDRVPQRIGKLPVSPYSGAEVRRVRPYLLLRGCYLLCHC